MPVILGAIADDFTGATDLANVLVRQGMRTVQVLGVPDQDASIEDAEAVIIALKIRTAPVGQAVETARAALRWLEKQGVQQVLFKYCSTFDSTPEGNIGPIADALMEALKSEMAFVCPAFPENGRTVAHGHLFVNGTLLSESPMKDHPLTPMRDSQLCRLMSAQSAHEVGLIDLNTVRGGPGCINAEVQKLSAAGKRYAVVDAMNDDDVRNVGLAASGMKLVTGGSAVAMVLPDNYRAAGLLQGAAQPRMPQVDGRTLILAGSCSAATRAQVASAQKVWPARQLDVDALMAGDDEVSNVIRWAMVQSADVPTMVYSSTDPEEVRQYQEKHGRAEVGERVEAALSQIAVQLRESGYKRFIVAGGETSGAVSTALGVKALRIGPEIAPGVPWTESQGGRQLALALKSGNFGGPNFFQDAWAKFHE